MTPFVKKFWPVLFICFILFWALPLWAAELEVKYPTILGFSLPLKPTLPEYVKYINVFSIAIAGILALAAFIYGGFKYLVSFGNPALKADARDQIAAGLLGLLIILGSYLILSTISTQFVIFPELKPGVLTLPEQPLPSPPEQKEQPSKAFQIPVGKIIEKTLLDDKAKARLERIRNLAAQTQQQLQELQTMVLELKALVDACSCGTTTCDAGCSPVSCRAQCDLASIQNKISEIKNSSRLQALLATRQNLANIATQLQAEMLELYKAATLMGAMANEVMDYHTFSVWRNELANARIPTKVEVQTYPGWEDIQIKRFGKIEADPATFYFWIDDPSKQELINFVGSITGGVNLPDELYPGPIQPPELRPGQFIWPTRGRVTQEFGAPNPKYRLGYHAGIDIANAMGTSIWAAADGIVVAINNPSPCNRGGTCDDGSETGVGLGKWVLIRHPNEDNPAEEIYSLYAHLGSISVGEGDKVTQGQIIGTMDNTGFSCGSHLHLEMRVGYAGFGGVDQGCARGLNFGTLINPRLIIPGNP